MGEQRNLIVVRHAKSDWSVEASDFDRPLNRRGLRDAPAAGRWLAGLGVDVEAAVVSPAARTRRTWELLAQAAGLDTACEYVRGLYLGEAEDLAQAVQELPAGARGAVLVAHWPGCPDFVEWVVQGRGEAVALQRMREKFPTAGAAWLVLDGDWADLRAGCGYLQRFEVCRG